VNRSFCLRLATIGALALSLALGACGRKGALDPPPGAWVSPPGTTPIAQPAQGERPGSLGAQGSDGKPIAPAGPNRRLPGDWLLD
jgi:predicted small lipoprotein YifL